MHAPRSPVALAVVAALTLASAAEAQTATTRNEKVAAGKTVRILASTNLKQDCSEGPATEVRIATPPANGVLGFKAGRSKTPSGYRCPNKETTVQVLTYTGKPDFAGKDTVRLDIKTSDGRSLTHDVKITVEGKPDDKKDDAKDSGSLGDL